MKYIFTLPLIITSCVLPVKTKINQIPKNVSLLTLTYYNGKVVTENEIKIQTEYHSTKINNKIEIPNWADGSELVRTNGYLQLDKITNTNVWSLKNNCFYYYINLTDQYFLIDPYNVIIKPTINYQIDSLHSSGILCTNQFNQIETLAINQDPSLHTQIKTQELLSYFGQKNIPKSKTSLNAFPTIRFQQLIPNQIKNSHFNKQVITSPKRLVDTVYPNQFLSSNLKVNTFNELPIPARGTFEGFSYRLGELIDEGGSGKVHKLYIDVNGNTHEFAVKFFYQDGILKSSERIVNSEINNAPYFLYNFGFSKNGYMQIQELGGKSLSDDIYSGTTDNAYIRGDIFHDFIDGVSFLHERNLVHGDLKPDNIVKTRNRYAIIDLDNLYKKNAIETTPFLAAPELFLPNHYLSKSYDIYALGISIFIAKFKATGEHLGDFLKSCCELKLRGDEPNIHELFLKAIKDELNPKVDQEIALIVDMLHPNPNLRPSIADVKVRWEKIYPRVNKAKYSLMRLYESEII